MHSCYTIVRKEVDALETKEYAPEMETEAETATEVPCAGDFVEAGFAGCATTDTIRRFGWEAILAGLRRVSLGSASASLAREAARLFVPEVWRRLLGMIADGSVPAVKLFMELCRETSGDAQDGGIREDGVVRQLRDAIFAGNPGSAAEARSGG